MTVWARLVHRWGWRAYAVPVLAVVTVVVLLRPGGSSAEVRAAAAAPAAAVPASAEDLSPPQTLARVTNPGDSTACAGNTVARSFVVSISAQHAWACDAGTLALSTPVTTGVPVPDRETRVGSWTIQSRETDRTLVGPGYSEHVDYWLPYDGDFGLHDALFQKFAFGTDGWKTDGSHGCVHLPLDAMKWVYDWAQVGTTTVTIKA